MSDFTVNDFRLPDGSGISVVVVDQAVFDECVDQLSGVFNAGAGERVGVEQAAMLKAIGNIPMIGRGTKTDFLFERFGVSGDRLGLVVRGFGKRVVREVMGDVPQDGRVYYVGSQIPYEFN